MGFASANGKTFLIVCFLTSTTKINTFPNNQKNIPNFIKKIFQIALSIQNYGLSLSHNIPKNAKPVQKFTIIT